MRKPNNVLQKDVSDELSWDPRLDDSQISVKAEDGHITLTGAVPTYSDLAEATDDAWAVRGVRTVNNELLVGPLGETLVDADIAARCLDALDADRFVPKGAISVDVLDAGVTLNGRVNRHFQRQAANYAVQRVKGVRGITNNVVISAEPIPSDVADRINKALARKAVLKGSVVQVTNSGGTIYLDGTTDSYIARQTAVDTASAAPGVTDVVDRIDVVA
jgi:osmotically-inducible protein OsmY